MSGVIHGTSAGFLLLPIEKLLLNANKMPVLNVPEDRHLRSQERHSRLQRLRYPFHCSRLLAGQLLVLLPELPLKSAASEPGPAVGHKNNANRPLEDSGEYIGSANMVLF
jgi:hypothetical protein